MDKLLLMFLDIVVLGALAGMMYYMRNMTASLKVIREGKTELQQLLQQLNIHISNAHSSVEGMKKLADDKAKTLQRQIDTAGSVAEELQFIQKAADNVAQRLEKLTGQAAAPIRQDQDEPAKATGRQVSKAEKELADALAARRAQKAAGE